MAGQLILTGTLRSCDPFGRLRLELEAPPDCLRNISAIVPLGAGRDAYRVATLTPPARHAALYAREAADFLDQRVRATAKLRRFRQGDRRGVALDLVDLEAA